MLKMRNIGCISSTNLMCLCVLVFCSSHCLRRSSWCGISFPGAKLPSCRFIHLYIFTPDCTPVYDQRKLSHETNQAEVQFLECTKKCLRYLATAH